MSATEEVSYVIERTGWPAGEWDIEPDREVWTDPATGFPCLMVRNPMGFLCGYVAVAEGHPAFGKPYDELYLHVHGDVTYAAACEGRICHVPEPGQPDNVWWLGFHCGNGFDLSPAMMKKHRDFGIPIPAGTYRNWGYVKEQCESLALQLKQLINMPFKEFL